MPNNVKYPYEGKILEAVGYLGNTLFGESRNQFGFILELDEDAEILKCYDQDEFPDFSLIAEKLECFIMYVVYPDLGQCYLRWKLISKDNIESLLKITFVNNDFISLDSDEKTLFPESHTVTFA